MTTLPITCPSCGVTNPVGKQACTECDTPLDGSTGASSPVTASRQSSGTRRNFGNRHSVHIVTPNIPPEKVFDRLLWRLFRNSETPSVEVRVTSDEIEIEGAGSILLSRVTRCEYIPPEHVHSTIWHAFQEVDSASSVRLEYRAEDGTRETLRLWSRKGLMPGVDAAARLHSSISGAHGKLENNAEAEVEFGDIDEVEEQLTPEPVPPSFAAQESDDSFRIFIRVVAVIIAVLGAIVKAVDSSPIGWVMFGVGLAGILLTQKKKPKRN